MSMIILQNLYKLVLFSHVSGPIYCVNIDRLTFKLSCSLKTPQINKQAELFFFNIFNSMSELKKQDSLDDCKKIVHTYPLLRVRKKSFV